MTDWVKISFDEFKIILIKLGITYNVIRINDDIIHIKIHTYDKSMIIKFINRYDEWTFHSIFEVK
jgi:hypothetical protein